MSKMEILYFIFIPQDMMHNKLKTANKTINSNAGGMTMSKIQMTTPLVEMDGDEMTRILWKMIKDELLLPFIDLKTEYYDLG